MSVNPGVLRAPPRGAREPPAEEHDMIAPHLNTALAHANADDLRRAADAHRLTHRRPQPRQPVAVQRSVFGRIGPRPRAAVGLATAASGLAVRSQAGATSGYATAVLPGLVLVAFGAGLSLVAITTGALAQVDEAAAGLASGLLSSAAMAQTPASIKTRSHCDGRTRQQSRP